jgi:serine/threonine-protein kinase
MSTTATACGPRRSTARWATSSASNRRSRTPSSRASSPSSPPSCGRATSRPPTSRRSGSTWNRRTEPDLRRAIDQFLQAIAADPDYALAHAGLADAWAILLDHGLAAPQEALPHAIRAAERALQLDPRLAEAHTSLAMTRQFDGQWGAAEDAFREALRCNPAYPVAHHRYALFLAWMGRADEALARIEEARRLDPISLIIQASIGWILYYARRFDDAERHLAAALEMDPHYTNAHIARALVLAATGRAADAIAPLETALHDSGGSAPILALNAYECGAAGDARRARELNTRLDARSAECYVAPYYRALPHLGLGEPDAALDWLERARRERSAQLIYLATDPIWDPVRADPRFRSIIAQLRFPGAAVS